MKIYSIACTRDKDISGSSLKYENFCKMVGVDHKWLVGEKSIFDAYEREIINFLNDPKIKEDDVLILCHDDIEIWDNPIDFFDSLKIATLDDTGFVGVAGTTFLDKDSVWWDLNRRKAGYHRGFVWQGTDRFNFYPNQFGPPGRVCVLDGCFLAASFRTLRRLYEADRLKKPFNFTGDWDFYDLHYTMTAHELGLKNMAVSIHILHNSRGELAGRTSWHENRKAFISNNNLPVIVK